MPRRGRIPLRRSALILKTRWIEADHRAVPSRLSFFWSWRAKWLQAWLWRGRNTVKRSRLRPETCL
ncbi:protein of unassigned function [Methylobacterium oryzae CBMB20]|uniref:Protein of unassigned function n=1 Tax=Methylobacterium oryzae CBMB20 TaxID=693986 RepID=A0A089NUI0_9HYPH|nr:protein of unassigned function [Methylobacterium oryzae CBMB20]